MFKKTIISMVALSMFIAVPAFAKKKSEGGKCKEKDVAGAYFATETQDILIPLIDGRRGEYGSRYVVYVYQLNLHAGGTASLDWTARSDFMVSEGTISEYHGSWACRKDGKVVMSTIGAYYAPTSFNPYRDTAVSDIELGGHNRHNRLFSVEDKNTVVMRETVRRFFAFDEDPSDPLGGFQFPTFYPDIVFTRLLPSNEGLSQ